MSKKKNLLSGFMFIYLLSINSLAAEEKKECVIYHRDSEARNYLKQKVTMKKGSGVVTSPGNYLSPASKKEKILALLNANQTLQGCAQYLEKYYLSEPLCGQNRGRDMKVEAIGVLQNVSDNTLTISDEKSLPPEKIAVSMRACPQKRTTQLKSSCKDNDFCINASMPLLSQGSYLLPPILRALEKNENIKFDSGWCAPVASTMALSGVVLKSIIHEVTVLSFLRGIHHPDLEKILENSDYSRASLAGLDKRTEIYGSLIHSIGNSMKTNWVEGGTNIYPLIDAIEKYNHQVNITTELKQYKIIKEVYSDKVTDRMNFEYFQSFFKENKPGIVILGLAYQMKTSTVTNIDGTSRSIASWKSVGGHAMALNGYDEGHLKIYDPWGRVYNVDAVPSEVSNFQNKMELRHINGTPGMIKNYSKGTDNKVIFSEYVSYAVRMISK